MLPASATSTLIRQSGKGHDTRHSRDSIATSQFGVFLFIASCGVVSRACVINSNTMSVDASVILLVCNKGCCLIIPFKIFSGIPLASAVSSTSTILTGSSDAARFRCCSALDFATADFQLPLPFSEVLGEMKRQFSWDILYTEALLSMLCKNELTHIPTEAFHLPCDKNGRNCHHFPYLRACVGNWGIQAHAQQPLELPSRKTKGEL